jgi:hypothetical protein
LAILSIRGELKNRGFYEEICRGTAGELTLSKTVKRIGFLSRMRDCDSREVEFIASNFAEFDGPSTVLRSLPFAVIVVIICKSRQKIKNEDLLYDFVVGDVISPSNNQFLLKIFDCNIC